MAADNGTYIIICRRNDLKITFFIHSTNNETDKLTIDSINQSFLNPGAVSEIIKQPEGASLEKIINQASGDYIVFFESGCLLEGQWSEAEMLEDIYKIPNTIGGRAIVNIDNIYKNIENHCTYVFKKEALKNLKLYSTTLFWQLKEAIFKILDNKATIAVTDGVSGKFTTFSLEREKQFENNEAVVTFVNNVIYKLAKDNGETGGFNWERNLVVSYFAILKDLVYKMGSERELQLLKDTYAFLELVNEDSIMQFSKFTASEKLFFLKEKNSTKLKRLVENGDILYFHDSKYLTSEGNLPITFQFIKVEEDYIEIEGSVPYLEAENKPKFWAYVNGQKLPITEMEKCMSQFWNGKTVIPRIGFCSKIPIPHADKVKISFVSEVCGMSIIKTNLRFNKFTPLYNDSNTVFYVNKGWILTADNSTASLMLSKESEKAIKACEKAFEAELRTADFKDAIKTIFNYKLVKFVKKHSKNRIWLISDRINRGDDNGEAFFKYLSDNKNKLKDVKYYFVIQKNCPDAARVKKYGKLIEPMSLRHKLMHLLSEYVISSQGNDPVVNPFKGKQKFYRPLLQDSKFVFLQHGITKDNQSAWLNKYNRNIYGLITSTKQEFDSMMEYDYYYTPDRIWLTGMPRFDLLYHDERKYITIMPTWRKSLMAGSDPVTSIWLKGDNFDSSEYVKFYNKLLNNEEFIGYCKAKGYTLCFMPHPNIAPYVSGCFKKHKDVIFVDAEKTYRDIFAETDIMVTDYSSVAFDFAYLRKPIVYCHFDRDDFFNGSHSYTEGYFDYERDGFGPVCLDVKTTIDTIKSMIESGCKIDDEYRARIDKTFAFSDKNSSERVLDKLL